MSTQWKKQQLVNGRDTAHIHVLQCCLCLPSIWLLKFHVLGNTTTALGTEQVEIGADSPAQGQNTSFQPKPLSLNSRQDTAVAVCTTALGAALPPMQTTYLPGISHYVGHKGKNLMSLWRVSQLAGLPHRCLNILPHAGVILASVVPCPVCPVRLKVPLRQSPSMGPNTLISLLQPPQSGAQEVLHRLITCCGIPCVTELANQPIKKNLLKSH